MTKQNKTLSEKIEELKKEIEDLKKEEKEFDTQQVSGGVEILRNPKFIPLKAKLQAFEESLKHIQNTQRRLKEELKEYWDAEGCFVLAEVNERIDKIFKEEFGEEILK